MPRKTIELAVPEQKTCAVCGRSIEWRKKWARDWAAVKFCSTACRSNKSSLDAPFEAEIMALLHSRARNASICPSEVARRQSPDDWRGLMEPIRNAARRLAAQGALEITQGNHVVDPSTAKGPIRLRLKEGFTGSSKI